MAIINKENSDEFYRDLADLAHRKKFPSRAMFELTYGCNFRCVHCYVVANKKKELATEKIRRVLDQLAKAGCFHIGFTGGEPFSRTDIFEILEYAKSKGFRISILTNGFLINKKTAQQIAALGASLNRVDISVLGATEKTFERITRKKGSFKRMIRAIKLLKAEGVPVQIKAPLLDPNKHEFLKIRKLAQEYNTMFKYNSNLMRKVDGNDEPMKYQVDIEEVFKITRALSKNNKVIDEEAQHSFNLKNIGRKDLFRCGAGQTEVSISPYGEMNLCLAIHYPQYNILRGSFKDGWNKLKKYVKDFKPSKKYLCRHCQLASFCEWCPAQAYLETGSMEVPIEYYCKKAHKIASFYNLARSQ